MIEAKYILQLCDRFDKYLVPLDVDVLRQRYNAVVFKSTYAVAREMGISDETVRTIENRALDALAHCLDLEANGQDITPMRLAKSFRQPVASMICSGFAEFATAAVRTAHRGELLIFASSGPCIDVVEVYGPYYDPQRWQSVPLGVIVGRVFLVDCVRVPNPRPHPHQWILCFEQPEHFPVPIPYSGQPNFFYVNNEVARKLPPRYEFSF